MASAVQEHTDDWYNVACEICGKRFHLKPYKVKTSKHHYCSIACHRLAKMEYMKGEKNHQYGLRGKLNSSWNGGRRRSHYGYTLVLCEDHPFAWNGTKYVFEHRLVAEQYLLNDENSVEIDGKRYLSPEYVVHHKNENRQDNRVENLCVMTLSEHQRMHTKEKNKCRERDAMGRFIS